MDLDLLETYCTKIQSLGLNSELIKLALSIPNRENKFTIPYIKDIARRESDERGISYYDILADIIRYYRTVNGYSLSYE